MCVHEIVNIVFSSEYGQIGKLNSGRVKFGLVLIDTDCNKPVRSPKKECAGTWVFKESTITEFSDSRKLLP